MLNAINELVKSTEYIINIKITIKSLKAPPLPRTADPPAVVWQKILICINTTVKCVSCCAGRGFGLDPSASFCGLCNTLLSVCQLRELRYCWIEFISVYRDESLPGRKVQRKQTDRGRGERMSRRKPSIHQSTRARLTPHIRRRSFSRELSR